MTGTSSRTYILAIPGTEQTQEMSSVALHAALTSGEITPDYWVWSEEDSDWKQISDIPALQPSPVSRPVPIPVTAIAPQQVAPIETKKKKAWRNKSATPSYKVKDREAGLFWVNLVLTLVFAVVALVLAANYIWVDRPFQGNMARTPFVFVPAYAHLGSFVQPDSLVIHLPPNRDIDSSKFVDFLWTTAKSTPSRPFRSEPFQSVSLAPAWVGRFAFTGAEWQALGQMDNASPQDRQNFITDHVTSRSGQPLIENPDKLSPSVLETERSQVWQEITSEFLPKS